MHRDYQSNMPIRLYQFDDHIEIMNAGGLYGEARPENFPNVNDYRNPLVASAMKTMGYVNMFNRGVGQVQTDLKENKNKPALFDVSLITAFKVNVFSTFGDTQDVPSLSPALSQTCLKLCHKFCPKLCPKFVPSFCLIIVIVLSLLFLW